VLHEHLTFFKLHVRTTRKQDQVVREYLQMQCNSIAQQCRTIYGSGGGSRSSGVKFAIQHEISTFLISVNHPIAIEMLGEYQAQWKAGQIAFYFSYLVYLSSSTAN